ncbi:MAG: hypothetical protein ABGX07_04310 [Pirellulaceae bacterium]
MRRRNTPRHSLEPSLFPFLAVLICTMGALVALLVLVVQQARVDASVVNDGSSDDVGHPSSALLNTLEGVELEVEHGQWRVDVFRQQREEVLSQVDDRRAILSHLESHIRELEDQGRVLQAELEAMRAADELTPTALTAKEAELDRLQRSIGQMKQQLDKSRQSKPERPAFAILPFEKNNGTQRRPIYLEFVEEGILIQPEGVMIANKDLEGPLGPGNPLDAALRTIRDYWLKADGQEAGSAYPLMVVRPQGTLSYMLGRAAISSWDDEFGYELIDGEMKLAFPRENAVLADLIRRSISDARQRQRLLQKAMPSHPQGGGFIVSRNGGLVPVHGTASRSNEAHRSRGVGAGRGGDGVGVGQATQDQGEQQQTVVTEETKAKNSINGSAARQNNGDAGSGRSGATSSLAEARGTNWALPGKGARGTAYTNPIRIAVTRQSIILLPNNRQQEVARPFVLGKDLTETVDQLVIAIHHRIKSWGVAPSGGYWQPELVIHVEPGAGTLMEQVNLLLQGSGLTIKRSHR